MEGFVTLATTDGYALGALVLAQSIRQVGTTRKLIIMITKSLSDLIRKCLSEVFDEIVDVDELNSGDDEHLKLLNRPELGVTFTKINCWLLTKYSKCVFLDSDFLILKSIDDLFEREEFSAAPDAGWPDCFNSGLFVFRPSKQTFQQLMLFASQQNSSFDGGDQGLLNSFFSSWSTQDISRHVPFTYNVTSNTFYSYLPAITKFRNEIRGIHFAGSLKPWQLTYNPANEDLSGNLSSQNTIQREFLLLWWRTMHQHVWPILSKNNQLLHPNDPSNVDPQNRASNWKQLGLNESELNYQRLTNDGTMSTGSAAHRRAWESGQIDYQGRDSFQNIEQQLNKNLSQPSPTYHPSQSTTATTTTTTTTTTTGASSSEAKKDSASRSTPPKEMK